MYKCRHQWLLSEEGLKISFIALGPYYLDSFFSSRTLYCSHYKSFPSASSLWRIRKSNPLKYDSRTMFDFDLGEKRLYKYDFFFHLHNKRCYFMKIRLVNIFSFIWKIQRTPNKSDTVDSHLTLDRSLQNRDNAHRSDDPHTKNHHTAPVSTKLRKVASRRQPLSQTNPAPQISTHTRAAQSATQWESSL